MFKCQQMFGEARGAQMCAMIEAACGEACPCKGGRPCPLIEGDCAALKIAVA